MYHISRHMYKCFYTYISIYIYMYTFIATSLWNLEDCDSPARPRLAGVERSDEPEPEEEVSSDDSDWLMDL